jgi:hypothetical protein
LIWTDPDRRFIFNPQNSQFLASSDHFDRSQSYEVIDFNIDDRSFRYESYQSVLSHFHLFVTSGLPNKAFGKFMAPWSHQEFLPVWSAFVPGGF